LAGRKKKKSRLGRFSIFVLKVLLMLIFLSGLQVLAVKFINPPFTVQMLLDKIINGKPLISQELRHGWRNLDEISPNLRRAVIAGEDQRFISHHGFDFIEMNRAFKDLISRGDIRGASTISMQAARTVFLWPDRSLIRKILEAYYTMLVELFWSKQRILEVYLNTVDWGTGIMGAESAARRYFYRSATWLSPSQAAALAAVLPSPHRWSPIRPSERVLKRKKRILRDMKKMPLLKD